MGACGQSEKGKGIEWMLKIEYVRLSDRVLAFLVARARISIAQLGVELQYVSWRLMDRGQASSSKSPIRQSPRYAGSAPRDGWCWLLLDRVTLS